MGAKALKTLTVEELDQTFLSILTEQFVHATEEASFYTGAIFQLAASYMDKAEFGVLEQFYNLYFKAASDVEAKKAAINEEVDDLFTKLQAQHERGEELSAPEEDEAKKHERLSLAAIQKKLETLITLDNGIRQRILPALSSMQFEDAARQRVEHIVKGWTKIIASQPNAKWEEMMREIGSSLTSMEESQLFYRIVLGEEAPEGFESRSIFLEF